MAEYLASPILGQPNIGLAQYWAGKIFANIRLAQYWANFTQSPFLVMQIFHQGQGHWDTILKTNNSTWLNHSSPA